MSRRRDSGRRDAEFEAIAVPVDRVACRSFVWLTSCAIIAYALSRCSTPCVGTRTRNEAMRCASARLPAALEAPLSLRDGPDATIRRSIASACDASADCDRDSYRSSSGGPGARSGERAMTLLWPRLGDSATGWSRRAVCMGADILSSYRGGRARVSCSGAQQQTGSRYEGPLARILPCAHSSPRNRTISVSP